MRVLTIVRSKIKKRHTRPSTNSQSAAGSIFISGHWKYHYKQYKQYNQYYGPFPQEPHFNSRDKTVVGHGVDNVDQYALNGTYSEATGQIEMRHTYPVRLLLQTRYFTYFSFVQIGTGDPNIN